MGATGRRMEVVEGDGDIEIVFTGKPNFPKLGDQIYKSWWQKTPNGSRKSRVNLYLDQFYKNWNGAIMNGGAKLEDVCQHEVIHALGLRSHTEAGAANYSIMSAAANSFGL